MFLVVSCELPARRGEVRQVTTESFVAHEGPEEYVMITTAVTMPMYVNHDQAAFLKWGKERNVNVSILGPADWDVPSQINTL